ncbi:MAG: tetratricopeptide repeat protein [Syntrophales bacterium]
MNNKRTAFFFLTLCIYLIISVPETGAVAAQLRPNQLHSYLRQGIEKVFNLEPQSANIHLQRAVDLDRENPIGYAFFAVANLFFYEISLDQKEREKYQESMLRYVSEATAKGQSRIEKNPNDGQAYFATALAKIIKVRWAIGQKQYRIVAQEASKMSDYLEKAKEEDPQNYDTYFLMGLLHYHLDHLPPLARFFSSLLIASGDSKKGLQELELAAQKGDLLKELAQSELASVYVNFEKQPARAIPIARELRKRFPRNYNFSFTLANALSELHQFQEAFAIAHEIEKGIQAGKPPLVPQLQPRFNQLLGGIFFNEGEYTKASEYFEKTLTDRAPYNARVRARALVRLGMIHDALKERKQAEEYYNRALAEPGGEGFAQVEARKYLDSPYVPPPKPRSR